MFVHRFKKTCSKLQKIKPFWLTASLVCSLGIIESKALSPSEPLKLILTDCRMTDFGEWTDLILSGDKPHNIPTSYNFNEGWFVVGDGSEAHSINLVGIDKQSLYFSYITAPDKPSDSSEVWRNFEQNVALALPKHDVAYSESYVGAYWTKTPSSLFVSSKDPRIIVMKLPRRCLANQAVELWASRYSAVNTIIQQHNSHYDLLELQDPKTCENRIKERAAEYPYFIGETEFETTFVNSADYNHIKNKICAPPLNFEDATTLLNQAMEVAQTTLTTSDTTYQPAIFPIAPTSSSADAHYEHLLIKSNSANTPISTSNAIWACQKVSSTTSAIPTSSSLCLYSELDRQCYCHDTKFHWTVSEEALYQIVFNKNDAWHPLPATLPTQKADIDTPLYCKCDDIGALGVTTINNQETCHFPHTIGNSAQLMCDSSHLFYSLDVSGGTSKHQTDLPLLLTFTLLLLQLQH